MKDINTIYQIMAPNPSPIKERNNHDRSKSPEQQDPTFYDLANAKTEKNPEIKKILT